MGPGRRITQMAQGAARSLRSARYKALVGAVIALMVVAQAAVVVWRLPQSHAASLAPKARYATVIAGAPYGANHAAMQSAADAAQWPQLQSNWCGVAAVAAVSQYDGVTSASQASVATWLNSDVALSAWGTPSTAPWYWGPAFKADISRDFGTDPRALAAAQTAQTNKPYHQAIVLTNAYDATIALAADLANTNQPITVFVDHALHNVVVSAVYATANPVTNPSSITGFEVWDPAWNGAFNAGIQAQEFMAIPLNTWLTSSLYWGTPYWSNYIAGYTFDPDPAVGPYTYATDTPEHQSNLWSNHYVYIRPDAAGSGMAGVSADWAENQSGELIKGWDNQIPAGYTGATSMFENQKITLNETSPYGLAFSARGSYDASAGNSTPASALAWTGTDPQHHLNILTSPDGMNYGAKITLWDTSILNPAILVAPPAVADGPNIVVLSWIGTDGGHSLNVMWDVYGQRLKLTLWNNSSGMTPAMTYFNGQVWVAWTGLDPHHTMNVIAMGPQGITQGAQTILWGAPGAQSAPQIATDSANNRMLLTWSESFSSHMMVMASSDGASWIQPSTGELSATSRVAPGLLALPNPPAGIQPIYLVQTALSTQMYFWRGSNAQGWTGTEGIPETSPLGTAMGYIGQSGGTGVFVVAWAGTDYWHHLNVALIQM